jgi:hypothetical protein
MAMSMPPQDFNERFRLILTLFFVVVEDIIDVNESFMPNMLFLKELFHILGAEVIVDVFKHVRFLINSPHSPSPSHPLLLICFQGRFQQIQWPATWDLQGVFACTKAHT